MPRGARRHRPRSATARRCAKRPSPAAGFRSEPACWRLRPATRPVAAGYDIKPAAAFRGIVRQRVERGHAGGGTIAYANSAIRSRASASVSSPPIVDSAAFTDGSGNGRAAFAAQSRKLAAKRASLRQRWQINASARQRSFLSKHKLRDCSPQRTDSIVLEQALSGFSGDPCGSTASIATDRPSARVTTMQPEPFGRPSRAVPAIRSDSASTASSPRPATSAIPTRPCAKAVATRNGCANCASTTCVGGRFPDPPPNWSG